MLFYIFLLQGVGAVSFEIVVRNDNNSELNETFTVQLTKVEAISTDVGQPSIDGSASTARLTVQANDKPYGEVSFSEDSISVSVNEEGTNTVTIVRDFGSFGTL